MLVPLTTTGSVDAPSSTGLLPVPVARRDGRGRRRRLVVLAPTAGEEERCDRQKESADQHLRRTVASPAALAGARVEGPGDALASGRGTS